MEWTTVEWYDIALLLVDAEKERERECIFIDYDNFMCALLSYHTYYSSNLCDEREIIELDKLSFKVYN